MRTAPEDLDLRQWNDRRLVAEAIEPERNAAACRRRMKNAERNGRQRVSPEPRLVRGAIEGDEFCVDRGLIERIEADESGRDFRGDPSERVLHVEAAQALASIPLVDRLTGTARRAGRRDASAQRAVAQRDFRLDCRASPRIPDAARDDGLDDRFAHRDLSLVPRSPLPLVLGRPAGASKDAPADVNRTRLPGPSFETRCCASLLRMRQSSSVAWKYLLIARAPMRQRCP